MKIAYASDIHTEMNKGPSLYPLIENTPSVLILSGDIAVGAEDFAEYLKMCQKILGCHIVATSGNHEYYDGVPIQQTDALIENLTRDNHKIHYLQNNSIIINEVKFIGGTLWTDFKVDGTANLWYVKNKIAKSMNDFRRIRVIRKNGDIKKLSTDYWYGFHSRSREYIYGELKNSPPNMKTVVVSHHGGIHQMNGAADWKQSYRAGYVSDISEIWDSELAPNYWICGHCHEQIKFQPFANEGTIFLENCYGYEEFEKTLTDNFKWESFEI